MKGFVKKASKWAGIISEKEKEGNWLANTRGNMAEVSTFIATTTFQIGVNPPGGVVQSDGNKVDCPNSMSMKEACPGQSVMAVAYRNRFSLFMLFNNISFFTSVIVCLWLACGVSLEHRFPTWVMATAICISLISLSLTYVFGVEMIGPSNINSTIIAWFAVVGVVVFLFLLRFLLLFLVILYNPESNEQTDQSEDCVN